jgi:thiamine kinase-like enzyme
VRELGGGRSNRSYLLESAGQRMVLRINAAQATLPGIGRRHEAEIWRAASDVGIAPPLVHADPAGKFLVSTYIESDLPDRPQDDPALAAQALELLQRTHRLDVHAPAIDYAAHIENYWQQIESRCLPVAPGLQKQREPMRQRLAAMLDTRTALTLCHHDLVVENFVGTPGRLYLLDWEYAAFGVAEMDYAALGIEWQLDDLMLGEQFGIKPALLASAKAFYRYMCDLWGTVRIVG